MWDDQSRISSYEAIAKGHTTQGILPNTVASLPVYIVDIVPNQCAHCRVLSLSSVWTHFGRSLYVTGVTSSMPEDDSAAITLQSALGHFSLFSRVSFFSRQKCTSLWIPYSFAPVAERCGSDKPCKVRRTHLKGTKPQGKRGKQQVPKEVRSYSTRRIRRRMSDGYSSTYTLHNRLRQDSFGSSVPFLVFFCLVVLRDFKK
jgi:hypothetical protein